MPEKIPEEKYDELVAQLKSLGHAAVAFSGGVDSTLLLHAAHKALGDNALAITASSSLFPKREIDEAIAFCKERSIPQVVIQTHQLNNQKVRENAENRCYHCKLELLEKMLHVARDNGITALAEGSNVDDESDYRPGARAITELGVLSPFRSAGLTKEEIRFLSRKMGLPTWNKPSFACLATRFEFGEILDEDRLKMIDEAEQVLIDMGFTQVRVRFHGSIARIELSSAELQKVIQDDVRRAIDSQIRRIGFRYVTLDLAGYQTGSMNTLGTDPDDGDRP